MNAFVNDAAAPAPAPVDATPSHRLASRGARLGAVLVDTIINMTILFTGGSILAGGFGALTSILKDGTRMQHAIWVLSAYALYLLLHGYLLATRGQTIGKRLCGIRIVRSDGRHADLKRILLLRWLPLNLLSLVGTVGGLLGLADALFVFRASRQCVHDQIADTIVVYADAAPLPT